MNNQTDNIIISNHLIERLIKSPSDQTIDGKQFKYLGKGSEGLVFSCAGKVVKIYTRFKMNGILKEFYVVGLLQEIDKINKNVIQIDKYYLSTSHPVMIMEMMDGDFSEWCDMMITNKQNFNDRELEILWLSAIFQITYGFMFLNKLKIIHCDTKPRNILYSRSDSLNTHNRYVVGNQSFDVPMNHYIFKIADFGSVQILGSTLNTMEDKKIQEYIDNRGDLYDLSRIWYRVLVDYCRNSYGWNQIRPIMDSNPEYKRYHDDQKTKLDNELRHLPQNTRDKMLLRAMIYHGIENNFINEDDIIAKHSLVKPPKLVMGVLDGLVNMNIKNVFDLFPMFCT